MTIPANNTTRKSTLPAVLLLVFGAVSLGCGCCMILFLIWGQLTQPPMYNEAGQVIVYLVCFTSPFLSMATALLAGGYYAYRQATASGNRPPAATPVPVVAPPAEVRPAAKVETQAQPGEPLTPRAVELQIHKLEGKISIEGLMDILRNPQADDETVELAIEALVGLGLPALEVLSEALEDKTRITRLMELKKQDADIEPLLRTGIASAAKYYRYKSLVER